MIELASSILDTMLVRIAIWLNTMHWYSIIADMDEHKDVRRQKVIKYMGILFIVTTIISEVVKWLFIENGNI